MPRFAAGLEYDGRAYSGWQFQPGLQTVQDACSARSRASPMRRSNACARDAPMPACTRSRRSSTSTPTPRAASAAGGSAPIPIYPATSSVTWLREVPGQFHARFSALARSYRYLILNRDSRPALAQGRATWERRPLDAARMHAAAQVLLGEHDFSAFRAMECQAKSPVRRVETLERGSAAASGSRSTITANAFLHHMVRNVAGLLMAVGTGESPPERVASVLAGRDRTASAATAPRGWTVSRRPSGIRPRSGCPWPTRLQSFCRNPLSSAAH